MFAPLDQARNIFDLSSGWKGRKHTGDVIPSLMIPSLIMAYATDSATSFSVLVIRKDVPIKLSWLKSNPSQPDIMLRKFSLLPDTSGMSFISVGSTKPFSDKGSSFRINKPHVS